MNWIENEWEYAATLKEVEPLFDKEIIPGTVEGLYFEMLVRRIEKYEADNYSI